MPKAFHPTALTANHLLDGDAVWWTGAGWSRQIAEAALAETPEAAEALAAAAADPAHEAQVVGPYTVELDTDRRPLLRREAIRAEREPTFAYAAPALPKAA